MFIKVRLLNGFKRELLYKAPDCTNQINLVGQLVQVPLRNKLVHALVMEQNTVISEPQTFAIKDIHTVQLAPLDTHYWPFISTLARHYHTDITYILRRLQTILAMRPLSTPSDTEDQSLALKGETVLTPEQEHVYQLIYPDLTVEKFSPTLLHGVTGSGKTEIYKKLICKALKQNKTTIFMLPEVTLALQFQNLLQNTLPAHKQAIFGFHSASSKHEKRALWQALIAQQPLVLLGVHLPVLLPISNLGLIIVDEEHETGYQEKSHPKINSKQAALIRAQQYKIPIVLGSATPALESLYNVHKRNWRFCQLTQRFAGSFAQVQVVQILAERHLKRRNFWISRELETAITECLAKHEQALIFLNRRGVCFFVQCTQCAHIVMCPRCSVSLTLHEHEQLHCHYCSRTQAIPQACPVCKNKSFLNRGIGTQHMVSILEKLFPTARIARADLDATVNKKNWQTTLNNFQSRTLDILVGTQTITKGYHFPHVTLVGIIWADLNLNFPTYNASETTLQQLIQVAGRAGRQRPESRVIVQTMSNHHIFSFINEIDYLKFYNYELEQRQVLDYPPCGRFAEIELINKNERALEQDAHKLATELIRTNTPKLTILGPTVPPIKKIKYIHRRKIYLKAPTFAPIHQALTQIHRLKLQSTWYFNPNPLQ